ncbi:MAG TPA: PQQ-binding-like beta-propeller repeat protein [Candidatus Acidoferrum sp.]|nr:PQQ-binding-like beta-propeller repeat protein [Candidatus Acidoferrum sp.]
MTTIKATLALALCCATSLVFAQSAVRTADANKAGEAIYTNTCAACHAKPVETKAPPIDTLKKMGPRAVFYALTNGKMKVQAAKLSTKDIDDVVSYLSATADVDNGWIAEHSCKADKLKVDTGTPTIGQWGIDPHNNRKLTAQQAGLSTRDMGKLELAWVMAFPQTANMRSQPVVVGNTMYLPIVDSGQLFALDIGGSEPCVKWVYQHAVPLRTSLGYHTLADGRHVLLFADAAVHVLMMDAATSEILWSSSVKVTSVSNVTAMPVLYKDKVFVPISSGELNMGAAPDYECCTSHGAVVALNANNGERLWVYHTMKDAEKTDVSKVGTQHWGPSGAPIWSAAAIDEKRKLIYVGTGENTSAPATDTSDAILAIRMDDGKLAWKYQTTPNDIFLTGCMNQPDGPNCPPKTSVNKDWDFGAGMMLAKAPSGRDLVLAGQKTGVVWAIDPDTGKPVWNTKVGGGGAMGGIHWGMAYDGKTLFAANNMSTGPTADEVSPGLYALDVNTGTITWKYLHKPDCSGTRKQELRSCDSNYGMSAATLLVDGAVVQGANDGFVKIFDAKSGEPLFTFDTARSFTTVNGVKGHGGAIDNASVVAANGMLFVQSGYGLMGVPGNLLLAFKRNPNSP